MHNYSFGHWHQRCDGEWHLSLDVGDGEFISFLRYDGVNLQLEAAAKAYYADEKEWERILKMAPACPGMIAAT